MDYLGTTDYLTSPVSGKVESWTHYNEWGLITHNAVLKCGQRELDLVKRYATHDYDSVLELYYAKARFYDAHDRRFTAVDPILDPSQYDLRGYVKNPVQLVQCLYVWDNPLRYVDPTGQMGVEQLRFLAERYASNTMPNQRLYAECVLRNGADTGTAAHEFIQIWVYKYLKARNGNVELEFSVRNPESGNLEEIDIVTFTLSTMDIYEVKAQSKAYEAAIDIKDYYENLKCDVNKDLSRNKMVRYGPDIREKDIPVYSFVGVDLKIHRVFAEIYPLGAGTIIYRFYEKKKGEDETEYATNVVAKMAHDYGIIQKERERSERGAALQLKQIFGAQWSTDLLDNISSNIPSVNLPRIEVNFDLAAEMTRRTGQMMATLSVSGILYLFVVVV